MSLIRKIIPFLFISLTISCATKINHDSSAKLSFFNSVNKKTFSFVVGEEFIRDNIKSKPSTLYSKMSVAELKLLMKFLQNNKYCINKNGELSFEIKSKQEKIYDVTFSSLIEQSYNARPVAPTTYFGECLN